MEAVPRLPMISCDIKISPGNTDFGHTLRKYIRDFYHEDSESYSKEIKDLETLRQNAIKAPMDFTGCSILKRYYAQLHKLQSRFPMTDDGPACVPFMWSDIYSGVSYNITDIEYEEACILYNIGALHSKLGTMDSRSNAEGMKIACTHFQCAAWAFQHLRDTYPQPKGSDMSHDLLTYFINIMLAQAQECILEKSMLDNRKSSITAKIAAQVVDYYKIALGIMVSGSPSTDTGSILDIVGSKIYKSWKKFIEFKMSYYASISQLYMGNQAEEHEKWGERVAWFQSANDHLTEAFKVAKSIDREDLSEPLAFTMDVIGGKLNSSKKENEFVYHDKVPAISSLPELKGASLVKGIPFSITDPDVSGPDIFARLVPMEAHETSSLYSEEKAKLLRSVVSKIEGKNEELIAYLSSLQLESGMTFEDDEKIPQELLEACAAMSVRPTAISDLQELMKELMEVSTDVDSALKSSFAYLMEEERRESKHQEVFGKRSPSLLMMELKKECTKYDEAHKKAAESNNTLEAAVKIHINNLTQLLLPLEELAAMLPSVNAVKTPENVKAMGDFNHLINKVEEMKKQRIFLEQQLRDALLKDDITSDLVTLKKKEDLQQVFSEELKKHSEVTTYLDQNLTAQDNILCALTEANAHYAETRKVIMEIKQQRHKMVSTLVNSFETYEDIVIKAKKGLDFYKKLQTSANRLLTRIRGVTKVQEEERAQIAEVRNGPRIAKNPHYPAETHVPKLKDYLPYLSKDGKGSPLIPPNLLAAHVPQAALVPPTQIAPEPMRQATLGGPATEFNRMLKPSLGDAALTNDNLENPLIGARPNPVGSEQPTVPSTCPAAVANVEVGNYPYSSNQQSLPPSATPAVVRDNYSLPHQLPSSAYAPSQVAFPPHVPHSYSSFSAIKNQSTVYSNVIPATNTNLSATNFSKKTNYQHSDSIPSLPQNSLSTVHSQMNNSFAPSISGTVDPAISSQNPMYYSFMPSSNGYTSNANSVGMGSNITNSTVYSPSTNTNYPRFPVHTPNSGFQSPDGIPSVKNSMPFTSNAGGFLPVSNVDSHLPSAVVSGAASVGPMPYTANLTGLTHGPGSYSHVGATSAASGAFQYPVSSAVSFHSVSQPSMTTGVMPQTLNSTPLGAVSMQSAVKPNNINMPADRTNYYQSGYQTSQGVPTLSPQQHTGNIVPQQSVGQVQSWPNAMQPSHYVPSSMYDTQFNSAYAYSKVSPVSDSSQTGTQAMQYYKSNVTASMDTNTTLHSTNQYPVPSSNNTMLPQHNANYVSNQPYFNYPNVSQSNMQTVSHNTIANQPISSRNAYSSGIPNNFNASSNQTNCYVTSSQGVHSQSMYSASVPDAALQKNVNVQPPHTHLSAQHVQPPASSYSNIQNYQLSTDASSQFSQTTSSLHQVNISENQTIPVSVESKGPSTSPPLQPLPSVDVKASAHQKPQSNAIRDLITPPLETESENKSVKDAESSNPPVLKPKVIDLKELSQLKEKEGPHLVKDPLDDPSLQSKFISEVEKYEKLVDGLTRKSLNGTTPLDQKWKEFIDAQDKESRKMSISVARCYPLKNRYPDVMPYDNNRVKLTSAKDDYVNASYLKDICPGSPVFVITQAPLPSTFNDFWLMIWEQQVETMICLLSDNELKNHVYFPKERGQTLPCGGFETSLQSYKEKNGFVERMINITHAKNRTSRVVVHLQFNLWPASGIPKSPAPLLQFISDVLSYQKQQRNLLRPVVVHCSSGIGRSGCFCLITALVNEMNSGHGPRDVAQVSTMVSQQRKFLIQDKDQLKFCYDSVLYYAQDLLMKRGILTNKASFEDKRPGSGNTSSHVRHPSEDFILGSGGLAKLQSGIENMNLSDQKDPSDTDSSQKTLNGEDCQSVGDNVSVTTDTAAENSAPISLPPESPEEADSETKNDKADENKTLPSITSLLDPLNFTLESSGSPAKKKITKENFVNSKGSLSTSSSDSADPLSLLDPLWSLKK